MVRTIIFNLLALILVLPLLIGIIDLWSIIVLNHTIILDWTQQKFTGAILLAVLGVIVKVADLWAKA